MLGVWCEKNREPDESGDLDKNSVKKDADALKAEQDDGGWKENRDQLELILMKKSMKYARAVLAEFEKDRGKPIEEIITGNIEIFDLNEDLADAYSSLAIYIKNKYQYVAGIMRKYCDGWDRWAIWSMCIAVTSCEEWPKINEAFKKDHPDDSLSKFILQKMTDDQVTAEMIAAVVDSTFKPTKFVEKPVQGSSSPPPSPPTITSPAG